MRIIVKVSFIVFVAIAMATIESMIQADEGVPLVPLPCKKFTLNVERLQCIVRNAPRKPVDLDNLTEENRNDISRQIILAGLRCPKVTAARRVTEDAQGITFKVECSSGDGKFAWAIRIVDSASGPPKFEPWKDAE